MFTTEEQKLDSIQRELIALRLEHGDLNALIDSAAQAMPMDQLILRRLKKNRLALRDKIERLESSLIPDDRA